MIKEYWNLIGRELFLSITWELHFSQANSFPRILELSFYENFRQTYWHYFLKKCKNYVFRPFLTILSYEDSFQKNAAVIYNYIWAPNFMLSFKKKITSQFQENLWTGRSADRRRDEQTLFYGTLYAEVGPPLTSLQQVTGGNTLNLVLKRILGYFLKIPPLKKILQF